MNLDELLAKVPDPLKPIAKEYGPALLKMTADEIWAWITLLIQGKTDEAYKVVLAKMDSQDLSAEWAKLNAEWATANAENAARINLAQRAALATVQAIFVIVLAMVGL